MKFCIRIAKLQSDQIAFRWCVTVALPNSYVIKLHLKHIELFSNLSIELASNKKRIRWCRKIKLYHKQSKNKNRYHTHTLTHSCPWRRPRRHQQPTPTCCMPQHACRTFRACRLPLCGNKKFVYKQANMSREMCSVASPSADSLLLPFIVAIAVIAVIVAAHQSAACSPAANADSRL